MSQSLFSKRTEKQTKNRHWYPKQATREIHFKLFTFSSSLTRPAQHWLVLFANVNLCLRHSTDFWLLPLRFFPLLSRTAGTLLSLFLQCTCIFLSCVIAYEKAYSKDTKINHNLQQFRNILLLFIKIVFKNKFFLIKNVKNNSNC